MKLKLPDRTNKPRSKGLSNLVDNGYGLVELADKLDLCADYVDIVKLGWASAYITKDLYRKVALFEKNGVEACPGGMMFELCWWQNKIDDYVAWLKDNNFKMVEVSNGSLDIPELQKNKMVEFFANKGFIVLSEVGSKDITKVSPPDEWAKQVKNDLNAGAWKVILEGRADASAGVYRSDGTLIDSIINRVLTDIPADQIIFEAPHKSQMVWFLNRLGSNVNIGNVSLGEILNLETLRLCLRGDTVMTFHNNNMQH